MKKIISLLFLAALFFSFLRPNLEEIRTLGFSEESLEKIMREIGDLFEDTDKISLDFSDLGAPNLIDPLLKILYIHMYPFMSPAGPVKNKECINVEILHLNLADNGLNEVPTWARSFPRVQAINLTGNAFPYWVLRNIAQSDGRIDIAV